MLAPDKEVWPKELFSPLLLLWFCCEWLIECWWNVRVVEMTNHWWLYKWDTDSNIWRCYPRWVISISVILKSDGNGLFLYRISTVPLYNECKSFVDVAEARDQTGTQHVIWDRIIECRNIFAAGRDTWIWICRKLLRLYCTPLQNLLTCDLNVKWQSIWALRCLYSEKICSLSPEAKLLVQWGEW